MKRIIVPTDFSKPAESAANYAASFAKHLSGTVELIHVTGLATNENSLRNWKTLEKEIIDTANENAKTLLNSIKSSVKITFRNLNGDNVEGSISKYASETDADFVVIGSRGASGLKRVLFGSNAANVINKCPKPVIVVPSDAKFNGFKKIVYATDMVQLDKEIKIITDLAKNFNAEVIILHVTSEDARKRDRSNLKDILTRMGDYQKIDFRDIGNDDVVAGIENEIAEIQPDLLVMFTHERDITDKLLGRGLTRQLAFHNSLPLLVINRDFVDKN